MASESARCILSPVYFLASAVSCVSCLVTHSASLQAHASSAQLSYTRTPSVRPQAPGDAFVVHARWDGPDGYQAWLDAPIRAELNEWLAPFVAGTMSGSLYDEIAL